jgi:pantoate kinase
MPPRIITAAERAARKAGKPWTGLGDVVASATKAIGIKPCAGCKKRQGALNKLVPFTTRPLAARDTIL